MISEKAKNSISYQALLDENSTLKKEIESLKARLEEAEELRRAISEGDLDALVIPGPERELVFTLDSADRAYRVLVETMNEGTATLAFDGTILYCNRRLAELLGMPAQAIVGKSIYSFIAPESEANFNALLKRRLNAGEIFLKAKDGKSVPVYMSINSLEVEAGTSSNSWCLVATDLTEQKKNEEVIASGLLARSIIEQAAEAIAVCDSSGRIMHFSDSLATLCGCDPSFQKFEEFMKLRFSDREDASKAVLPVSSALKGTTILGLEASFESKNQQKFDLLLNSGPLRNSDGEFIGCVLTLNDITERKQVEKILRYHASLVDNISEAAISTDPDFNILTWNKAAEKMYGWEAQEVLGKPSSVYLKTEYLDNTTTGDIIRELDEKGFWKGEAVHRKKDGTPICISASISALKDSTGKSAGVIAINRDITERKRAEEALRRNEAQQAFLLKLNDSIRPLIDAGEIQATVTGMVMDYFGADRCYYCEFEGDNAIIRRDALRGDLQSVVGVYSLSSLPIFKALVNAGGPIVIPDANTTELMDEELRQLCIQMGIISYINMPVIKDGKPVGNICITQCTPRDWTNFEVELALEIAERTWAVIERARTQEALRNSENQLNAVVQNVKSGIALVDETGKFAVVNPSFMQMFSLDSELDILNINSRDWSQWEVYDEDGELLHVDEHPVRKALITGKPIKSQLVAVRNPGANELTWMLISVEPVLEADGNVHRLVCTYYDITELKRIESELRKAEELAHQRLLEIEDLYRSAPIGLCMLDRDLRYVRINERLAEINGVAAEAHIGKTIRDVLPQLADAVEPEMLRVIKTGVPRFNIELTGETPAQPGVKRYWDEQWLPIINAEGDVFGLSIVVEEINERKQLEEQIRQHVEELETVMNVAPAAIWIGHDPRCNIITGNRMANEFYEVGNGENVSASATPVRRFFYEGRELAADELPMQEAALKDSDIRNVEFDVLLPSGKRRSFLGSASPLHDSEGKVRGSVGTFIDITERKQQEEALNLAYEEIQLKSEELETQNEEIQEAYRALSESEEKYRKLFENMHEGFFIADIITDEAGKPVDYRIIEANQAFKAQTGIPGKELIGKTALEVYPDLDPLWVQTYGSVALTGSPAHFDRYADPYGRHYEVLAYQIQPGRFAAIFLDITERKQVEEKLQKALSKAEEGDRLLAALMENVPEGITISDAFGRLRMVSRSGEKLLGGAHSEKSIDEVVTQWMVYQPDGVTPMDTEDIPLVRAVQKGEIVQNAELVQVNTLGEKISLLCNAAPIRDSIGNITGGIVAWHDITERKKAEEALRESEERYRTLFNTMEEGFCIIEVLFDERKKPIDYVFVETNPAFELQTGLEAVVGKRIREIIPGNEDYWYEIYGRIALTGESVRFENRAEELNRWYEVYAYRIGEPEARKVAVIFNDITERKQTEEALRESQARLETVFSATPDAIIEYDVNGKPVRVNDAALKAYGLRLPSLTRDKAVAELKIEHTDGSPVRVEELPTSRALKGEIVEGELYRFTDAEGKELIITTYAAPLFKDNRVNGAVALWHDITELKQTEEELRKSENLYRAIAKNFPNGAIYVFDRNLRFLVAEGEALELISWSQEKLEGKSVYDLDEETRKIIEPRYRSVLAGESLVFETAYRGRHILSQYVPIRNDQGEIFAGLVVGIDITKRKTMEAELAHQRELLQRIFDNIPVLLVIWDPHMERFTLNRHVEQVLGWTTADANNGDFMAKVYPDPAYRAEVSSYMLSLRSGWKEWIGATKNGQHVPIEWANIFLTDDTMIGIGVDLRERKKAEAKLKETLDNLENLVKIRTAELEEAYNSLKESEKGLAEAQKMAHIGNWHLNLMTNKIYWSDEVYRIFGFKPQEFEVTYNAFLNYVHPEDRAYINNTIKKALNGESYGIDFRIISENGKERMVYLQGELVLDDRQLPVGMRGTIQDITERKRAEEALAKIDEFRIKEIHHRIKNNLQVISSLLDLQAETFSHLEVCKAPEVLKAFKESQSRIASMALIHEELYNCKGSDNLDFAAYLRKLATYLLNLYNLKATAVSLKLELEEVYLDMDTAIPLGIIVNELVSNSLKHAFPNGKKPELRIILQRIPSLNIRERLASDDGCKKDDFCFSLTVADNGRGISEKIDIQTVESLGLQLVNILVEQIDGCIELKRNGGTRFIILFNSMEN
jgi:PAS domain S-box-containing protein